MSDEQAPVGRIRQVIQGGGRIDPSLSEPSVIDVDAHVAVIDGSDHLQSCCHQLRAQGFGCADVGLKNIGVDSAGQQRGVDAVENVSVGVARGQDGAIDHLASVATPDEFHVYPTRLLKCLDEALGQGEGIMGYHPNDPWLGRGSRIR